MENIQLSLFDANENPFILKVFNSFPENESDEVEYKLAEGGFPDEFWKTYSAFANSKGGIIVFGVKERKNEFIFEGIPAKKIGTYKKAFWDNANNPQKVSLNLLSDADLIDFTFEGNHFLAFRIPAAIRVQRPVYITTNPFDNTYKRNYEGDYKCTREEVRRMLADADLTVQPDSRILDGYSMDDFDLNSIRQYRQLFASTHSGHPWLLLDDNGFLSKLGAFRLDRKTKKEGATVAGMLMFGKTNSITDTECCPNFFPDYREILSLDLQIRWTDRIYPDGNWEANLFQFYRMVWPKLASSLPKPFQIKDGVRQDETPAHIALREAFVNALIHTDYSAPNNIVIEQRIDNYRFSNPGTLLVSIKQYYQGGTSECRNTTLQKMFLMIGSAEKAGSGVNKIIYGWEYAQWRRPYLIVESQPDRLILELPKFSILPEETNLDTSAVNLDSSATAANVPDYKSRKETPASDTLAPNLDTLAPNLDTSNRKSSKKLSKEELHKLIIEACKSNYITIEQIALAVNRSQAYLQNEVLPILVSNGKLERLYPDNPNHPNQAYKTQAE